MLLLYATSYLLSLFPPYMMSRHIFGQTSHLSLGVSASKYKIQLITYVDTKICCYSFNTDSPATFHLQHAV